MFDSSTFEHQPLVPTNPLSGKFDIDAFLTQAKSQQRRWFITASIFAILSLSYAGYLLAQFPARLLHTTSSTNPITACTISSTASSWGLTTINILLAIVPLICWGDQLLSFLKPAPSNGPGVIVFKPYYVRSSSNDEVTTPEQYFQFIRDRSINWFQTTIIIMSLLSGIGLSLTMFIAPESLCINSWFTVRIPYLIGTITYASLFIGVLATMIYQQKKQLHTPSGLDAYHPL